MWTYVKKSNVSKNKNTAHKVVYAFQCSRWREGARGEALPTWPGRAGRANGLGVWAAGPARRHSVGALRPAARWAGAAPAPGASGPAVDPGPAPRGIQAGPSGGSSDAVWSGAAERPPEPAAQSAFFRKISLRITHTGESVWMERRSASRGPKAGSTSPSATPL